MKSIYAEPDIFSSLPKPDLVDQLQLEIERLDAKVQTLTTEVNRLKRSKGLMQRFRGQ